MRVVVYRNLNAKTAAEQWSVAELKGNVGYGRKIAGVANITLANVVFHVTPSGARKLAAGENRSVHAWAIGDMAFTPSAATIPGEIERREIAYNPRNRPQWLYFHHADGTRVDRARCVQFAADGRAYAVSSR